MKQPDQINQNTRKIKSIISALLPWFSKNARDLPWRREPYGKDPYCVYVSEIMLQQTQVKTVIPYWERWMRELPTIQSVAQASPAKLHKLWEGLGYYTRVRNLQSSARQIIAQQGGHFPKNYAVILTLPGVGRYTAGAICSIAFNQPKPILDGNVIRVLTRLYGISTDAREKPTNVQLWQLAEALVLCASKVKHHASPCSHLNQSLMELGALVCTPRLPQCEVCPANKLCVARKKRLQEQLPNLGKRAPATARRFIAFVVESDHKFLVRQRPEGVVNAQLWEFPNVEVLEATALRRRVSGTKSPPRPRKMPTLPGCEFRISSAQPLCTIKHSITRYRITLEVYRAELRNGLPAADSAQNRIRAGKASSRRPALQDQWLTRSQLHQLAFTSAHKKILNHLTTPSPALVRRIRAH